MDYQTVKEIGRGGFGIVEEVRDSYGNSLARKRFNPPIHLSANEVDRLRERFTREVHTQSALSDQAILPIKDHHLDGTTPWFIMPLATKTYNQQIAEDKAAGRVDIDAIADILNALDYLHSLGYVHRDLNPKNILLHDHNWKLSDLGAILPPDGHTVTLTQDTVIYTESYCAPEQRLNFHRAKSSADKWCQIVSVNVFVLGSVSGFLFQQVPPHGVGPAVLVT